MVKDNKIYIGRAGETRVELSVKMANRHGLIAGATGTGKTVTLKNLAESFSDAGVPVFVADVKGDLAGLSKPGVDKESVKARIDEYGLDEEGFSYKGYPVNFWDVYGNGGMPLRTTVTEMGPLLMARVLGLNDTQTSVLSVVYKIADDEGLLLIDTKDLKAMLAYVGEDTAKYSAEYGNMSKQSLNTIIRAIVALEAEGGELFFGEPALDINDWLSLNYDGRGMLQLLDCRVLANHPAMYSTFLLWMISELYETLPEVGDVDKPRMVFFFDEAHLLFDTASKALLEKIGQVIKLIRSKGVGIFFITQSPKDIPDEVLAQLGCKIQHAMHAYTPTELKAVKLAADSFRANPEFNTYDTLTNLEIGEALVSVLQEDGVPSIVQRTVILPPQSSLGAIEDTERQGFINGSPLCKRYSDSYDRDSAFEFLQRRRAGIEEEEALKAAEAEALKQEEAERKAAEKAALQAQKEEAKRIAAEEKAAERAAQAQRKQTTRVVKNVASSAGSTIGRELGKTLGNSVGGSFGKKIGGNMGSTLGRGILSTLFKG